MERHRLSATIEQPVYQRGKQLAQLIFQETIVAIDVRRAMRAKIKHGSGNLVAGEVDIPLLHPPRVVAFGKAAQAMAAALNEILNGEIDAGVVVAPTLPPVRLPGFRYFLGGHPYPNAGSFEGAQAALDLVSGLAADDLVIFLVSGGGSALVEMPIDPAISLADLIEFNRVLVTSHLPIEAINILRKHLSAVKGGRLGARAHPAQQVTIYISDVPEGYPSMVASGPTLPDESTVDQCYAIAEQSGLVALFPPSIRKLFVEHALEETPAATDPRFRYTRAFCLLSNRDAVEAACAAAEKLGFTCQVDAGDNDRDFRQVVEANLASLDALTAQHPGEPVCLVVGGEVTCPVTGPGMGGRNQAFVLEAARRIAGQKRVVLSAGTDGRDGNSPSSGAVADGHTMARAAALGLDPKAHLAASDSYHFFCTLGDTLETGFTDNNVRDVRVWLDFGS